MFSISNRQCKLCAAISPWKVKNEQLAVLVVIDFTKLGTLTAVNLNKQRAFLAKILGRNQACFLDYGTVMVMLMKKKKNKVMMMMMKKKMMMMIMKKKNKVDDGGDDEEDDDEEE